MVVLLPLRLNCSLFAPKPAPSSSKLPAILQRVVALQEVAQQLLRLAAVVGRRVPRTLLVAVAARADLAEEAVLEALEGCVRARMLGETGEDAYQFTHD